MKNLQKFKKTNQEKTVEEDKQQTTFRPLS